MSSDESKEGPSSPPQAAYQVCKCCGVIDMIISGCSCLGGTSHECKYEYKKILTPARLHEALNAQIPVIDLENIVYEYLPTTFVSTWEVGGQVGTSPLPMYVELPLASNGTYDFKVSWGDGTKIDHITAYGQAEIKHTYSTAGIYKIEVKGRMDGFTFSADAGEWRSNDETLQILDISQWGCVGLEGKRGNLFYKCRRLRVSAKDVPDLSGVTNMSQMFSNTSFNGDVSHFDTSNVTNMECMFDQATSFTGEGVSGFDISNVTNMKDMFYQATSFKGDVSLWNVSNVTNMKNMFYGTRVSQPMFPRLTQKQLQQISGDPNNPNSVILSDHSLMRIINP